MPVAPICMPSTRAQHGTPEGAAGRRGECSHEQARRGRARVLPFPPSRAFFGGMPIAPCASRAYVAGGVDDASCSEGRQPDKRARMRARYTWRWFAHRIDVPRRLGVVRACVAIGRRTDWLAIGAAVGNASSRRLSQAGKHFRFASRIDRTKGEIHALNPVLSSAAPATLASAQRRTIDVGSWVVLSALGFGFQLGSWPVWMFLALIGIYGVWIVLYAEITVQATRPRRPWQRWRWQGRHRSRGRVVSELASASMPQPTSEKDTAKGRRKQRAEQHHQDPHGGTSRSRSRVLSAAGRGARDDRDLGHDA